MNKSHTTQMQPSLCVKSLRTRNLSLTNLNLGSIHRIRPFKNVKRDGRKRYVQVWSFRNPVL